MLPAWAEWPAFSWMRQPDGLGGRADVRAIAVGERNIQAGLVDLLGQQNQLVVKIEQPIEVGLEQFNRITGLGSRLHRASMPLLRLQGFSTNRQRTPQFRRRENAQKSCAY